MVAKTYDHGTGFDLARKYSELLEDLKAVGYETLPPAAILQLASLLICGEARKKDILRLPTKDFRDIWPRIDDAVKAACDYFRGAFRLPASRLLPYGSLIIPFAAFFDVHPDKPDGQQTVLLRELFFRISLTGRYTLLPSRRSLPKTTARSWQSPKVKSLSTTSRSQSTLRRTRLNGWASSVQVEVLSRLLLCLIVYQQPRSFDDDGIVQIGNDWLKQANSKNYHHFLPEVSSTQRGS